MLIPVKAILHDLYHWISGFAFCMLKDNNFRNLIWLPRFPLELSSYRGYVYGFIVLSQ